jgi:hypothetical protein
MSEHRGDPEFIAAMARLLRAADGVVDATREIADVKREIDSMLADPNRPLASPVKSARRKKPETGPATGKAVSR